MLLRIPRVKIAIKSLKKFKRKDAAKLPVTPEMLLWLSRVLSLGQGDTKADPQHVRVWVIINVSYFFLLRISEALVLVFGDLSPRFGGAYVTNWGSVDSVAVLITGSKTDQYNLGCMRTQHRVGGVLCPVGSARLWALNHGSDPSQPLAGSGRHAVKRELIQSWLRLAAGGTGVPPERIGTHSLRIGGATALHRAGWELAQIQRFGRWASGAFQGYLWDHHELTAGMAASMTKQRGTLHAGIFMHGQGDDDVAQKLLRRANQE